MTRGLPGLMLAALASAPALAQPSPPALTENDAVRIALARNPEVASRAAELQAGEARLEAASRLFQSNPELGVAAGLRYFDHSRELALDVEVAQRLELLGQRAARIEAARGALLVSQASVAARKAELAAEVRVAFTRAVSADLLLGLARAGVDLARETARAAGRRFEVGEGSKIEVNAARVEVGRALRELSVAAQRRAARRGELGLLLAIDAGEELRLAEMGPDDERALELEPLLRRALTTRADLVAARRTVDVARAAGHAAEKDWLPRPAVGARYQRDDGGNAVLGTLSFELPVFDRNQAGRGDAAAELIQAERALEAAERRARLEVRLAHDHLVAAREAARTFDREVIGAAQENLALLATAYRAGKLELFELLLIRRDAIESQRGYVESLEEVRLAEVELGRAIGAEEGRP